MFVGNGEEGVRCRRSGRRFIGKGGRSSSVYKGLLQCFFPRLNLRRFVLRAGTSPPPTVRLFPCQWPGGDFPVLVVSREESVGAYQRRQVQVCGACSGHSRFFCSVAVGMFWVGGFVHVRDRRYQVGRGELYGPISSRSRAASVECAGIVGDVGISEYPGRGRWAC